MFTKHNNHQNHKHMHFPNQRINKRIMNQMPWETKLISIKMLIKICLVVKEECKKKHYEMKKLNRITHTPF